MINYSKHSFRVVSSRLWSQVMNSRRFACICSRNLQRWLFQLLLLKFCRMAVACVLIVSETLWCHFDISLAVVLKAEHQLIRTQAGKSPMRCRDDTATVKSQTLQVQKQQPTSTPALQKQQLKQPPLKMQAKRQKFITWDHGPPARKTPYRFYSCT